MAKVKGIFAVFIGMLIAVASFFTAGYGADKSTPEASSSKKAAEDKKDGVISKETQTADEKIHDWSLDYPKRPLKKGEHLPFPRPAVE